MSIIDSFMVNEPVCSISINELQRMKKRVSFYVDHYNTIKRNRNDNVTYEDKINILSNIDRMLDAEIDNRKAA